MAGEMIVGQLCTKHRYTQIFKADCERGNWPTICAVKSGSWQGKSLSDTYVPSTGTRKYLKPTTNEETGQPPVQSYRAGGWGNHARRTSHVLHIYTKIFKGNWERGNWPTTYAVKLGWWLGKFLPHTCVLSTGTRIYLKPTVNGETGQPPVQSYRVGGCENHARRTRCVLHMYTKIFKGNREIGNWSTTCAVQSGRGKWKWGNWQTTYAVKSGRWVGKSLSDTYLLTTNARKYLKATGNGENGQPLLQSNRGGGLGKSLANNCGNWPTTCVVISGKWLGKSWLENCTLSTGTSKYLKLTVNGETGQPLVSSYRASGWGNHARSTSCVLHMYTKIFKGNWERVNWRTTFAVKSGRWSGKSLPDTCVLSTGTCKYIKPTVNGEPGKPPVQSSRARGW
ncbi:unnamed protein product [Prunus armeniaca]